MTTLDAMGGTFVDFTLPQEELAIVAVGLPVRVTMEGAKESLTGTISAIDPTVDSTTRNVKIRAAIPELPGTPRPGTFVNVDVIKPTKAQVVAVPATAIVHASFGDSVFVIEDKKPGSPGMDKTPDGKTVKIARQQFVRIGRGARRLRRDHQGRDAGPGGGERGRVQAAEQLAGGRGQHGAGEAAARAPPREPLTP